MNVVCVHGYLAPKHIFWPVARHLKQQSHQVHLHGYSSHRGTLDTHGDALARRLKDMQDEPLSLVAHSLGGIVVKNMLTRYDLPVEHIIFIATPHQGSQRSRVFRSSPLGRLMSLAVKHTAHAQYPRFSHPSVGIIAGRRDSLVKPHESRLECAKAYLELPFGHNDILLRSKTAKAVASFLRYGAFNADEPIDPRQLLK